MKSILIALVSFAAVAAHAEGGIECKSNDGKVLLSVPTTRGVGSAISDSVVARGTSPGGEIFSWDLEPKYVAQYKNSLHELYLLVLDDEFTYAPIQLEAKYNSKKDVYSGKLILQKSMNGKLTGMFVDVQCAVE